MTPASPATVTGGRLLVSILEAWGIDLATCVPGESYLPVLDALCDSDIRLVTFRQEGGAAFAAEAYGKATGRPAVCFVTRGPGASNAAIGVHTAMQDGTPLLLFIGQVPTGERGRGGFQEVELAAMFTPLSKLALEADRAERLPELLRRLWVAMWRGRPGPVVLALPEDVLEAAVAAPATLPPPPVRAVIAPPAADVAGSPEACFAWLRGAERPLLIVGGPQASRTPDLWAALAQALHAPIVTTWRRASAVDADLTPHYAGELGLGANPALVARVRTADAVLALGTVLGENVTQGWELFPTGAALPQLWHVLDDASDLGRVWAAGHVTLADPAWFARRLLAHPIAAPVWADWTRAARADYLRFVDAEAAVCPGTLHLPRVFAELRRQLPRDASVSNGAGNFAAWLHRYFPSAGVPAGQLAPTSGAMGYGLPAALAAKLADRARLAVCVTGDGDFLMTGQELATARQFDLPVTILLVNNGMYGTIRMHQERRYPGRVVGTDLVNPDFVALARAYGAEGWRVAATEEFAPALAEALAAQRAGRSGLIELVLDPDALSPSATISGLRGSPMSGVR